MTSTFPKRIARQFLITGVLLGGILGFLIGYKFFPDCPDCPEPVDIDSLTVAVSYREGWGDASDYMKSVLDSNGILPDLVGFIYDTRDSIDRLNVQLHNQVGTIQALWGGCPGYVPVAAVDSFFWQDTTGCYCRGAKTGGLQWSQWDSLKQARGL